MKVRELRDLLAWYDQEEEIVVGIGGAAVKIRNIHHVERDNDKRRVVIR